MLPILFCTLFKLCFVISTFACFGAIVKNPAKSEKIGIGVVFAQNTDEIQSAFKFAMTQHTNFSSGRRIDFQAYVDIINTADAFKLSRLICNQFARGVWSMLGAVTPDSFDTLHSYTNTFQMPFVTPWFPEKVKAPSSGLVDHAISMRPDYHRAVVDIITYYGWKNIIYLYDSHDGLLRLQQLYQTMQPGHASFRISHVQRVGNATDAVSYLRGLERLDRWGNKYVVLDTTTRLAKEVLVAHVRDVQLGRRNYHYFLSGLVMDDRWEKEVTEYGAINVTGFRVVDISRKMVRDFLEVWRREHHFETISAKAALMFDAVQVLIDALVRLQRKKPDIFRSAMRRAAAANNATKVIDCNPAKGKVTPFEHGDKISRLIKKTEIEGLTGSIRFSEEGQRHNFTLHVVEMAVDGSHEKIGTWYDYKGLVPSEGKLRPSHNPGGFDRNRTYLVTTILEPPYIMRRAPEHKKVNRNDAYKGFCRDLADILAAKLEIKYEMRLVKDGNYGSESPKIVGGWDGIVGELVRKEADMAIAPLTITLDRERVVDYSDPFLSLDFMPHGKKIRLADSQIFSFLEPLSGEVWVGIVCSVLVVSLVLFIVSRFSPCEWRLVSINDDTPLEHMKTVVNEFSFRNSLWFSLGSIMQQGSEFTPRSASGRIVGTVWWFFTLIVISFYTANLASHLTAERISGQPHSVSKVTACSEDAIHEKSGLIDSPKDITTDDQNWLSILFDKTARFDVPEIRVEKVCKMVVSISNSGIKDFAVAFPKGSALRDSVNIALQSLKDDGELQKLIQKWFTDSDCMHEQIARNSNELSLSQVAGLFYVLISGLGLALGVALFEFCQYGRMGASKANVPLHAALCGKANPVAQSERKSTAARTLPRDHDGFRWNGATFAGFYTQANQNGQEETDLDSNLTQV